MKAACSDILAAYAFGAAFEGLFKDLEEDMAVPAYPQLLSFHQPEPTPATTTTVELPIHLEPPPPTCTRSAYSCCCGMGEEEEGGATADGDGGGGHGGECGGESELDACSQATWGTLEDELHLTKVAHLPPIPERLNSCCSCTSGTTASGVTDDTGKGKGKGVVDEASTEDVKRTRMDVAWKWVHGLVPRRPRKQAKAE